MADRQVSTAEEYLEDLPDDRRSTIAEVRRVILDNLPDGYVESINWGMLSYEVPLERYPETYNGQPLGYVGLASQKRYMSLYLNDVYQSGEGEEQFRRRYEATGKKLDMGKSCVRFRRLDDLPLELIGETVAATPVDEFIARYERARGIA